MSNAPSPRTRADEPSGAVTSAITRGIVALYVSRYGRGPTHARTHVIGDSVVCILQDGLLPAELALIERGRLDAVHAMRRAWQDAHREDLCAIVEHHAGSRVRSHLSQIDPDADVTVEVFLLER